MLCSGRLLQLRVLLRCSQIRPTSRPARTNTPPSCSMQTACKQTHAASANKHDKPVPCNIESHLSKEASARTLSSLSKFIFEFSGIPGIVGLHGGLPPPSIFPFKGLKVQLEDGTWLDMSAQEKVRMQQFESATRFALLNCCCRWMQRRSTTQSAVPTFLCKTQQAAAFVCTLSCITSHSLYRCCCRWTQRSSITQMAEATFLC